MTVELMPVTEPGVHSGPDEWYHTDPVPGGSLSHSGARRLLPPSCPAKFAYEREHGRPPKAAFDLGHAAHRLVLGTGAEMVVVDAANWTTRAAKEARAAAYAAGRTPILADQWGQVQQMAGALRAHPYAAALLDPGRVAVEQSAFWIDDETGIWRRARLDAWGRYIADYKTTDSAEPSAISRSIWNYGYHMQADWYLAAAAAVGKPAEAFLLVFQETTPPYVVTVAQPADDAVQVGHQLNRRAIDIYRQCTESGHWPGYADDVVYLSLPPWAYRQAEEIL